MTNGIVTSIKYRDKMKRKLRKHYSTELDSEYRVYRNQLNKLIMKQKNTYYRNEIEDNKHNLKKMYEIIKDACCES